MLLEAASHHFLCCLVGARHHCIPPGLFYSSLNPHPRPFSGHTCSRQNDSLETWAQNPPVHSIPIQNTAEDLAMASKPSPPTWLVSSFLLCLTLKCSCLDPAIQTSLLFSEHPKPIPSSGKCSGLEYSSHIFIPRANTLIFCSKVTWSVRLLFGFIFSLLCISHHSPHYAFTVSFQPWNASSMRAGALLILFISLSPVPGTEPGWLTFDK